MSESLSKNAKKWWATVGIAFGMYVVSLDFSIVNTALSAIQRELGATVGQLQWVMNIMSLFLPTLLVTMGRFSDIFGRKKIFLIGLILFGVGAIVAAGATNIGWLIVGRGIQGISIAILLPVSQALITTVFPDEERGKAMGIWASVVGAGLASGPVLGGILVSLLNWRWIFIIDIPAAIISFVIVALLIRESKDEKAQKIDIPGVITLIIGIGCLVVGIVQSPVWGWDSYRVWGLLILGALFLISFFVIERKVDQPIIRFELFKNHQFFAAAVATFGCVFFMWVSFFFIPLYLHNMRQDPSYKVGLLMLFVTLPIVFFSSKVTDYGAKIGEKPIILLGCLFLIASVLIGLFFTLTIPIWFVMVSFLFFGIGWTLSYGPATASGIAALPKSHIGIAAGALTTIGEIGGSFGLAIAGALFRHIEHFHLNIEFIKEQFVLDSTKVNKIRSILSDPIGLESELSQFPTIKAKLLNIFQNAFMNGYHAVMWLLFALMVVVALIVFSLMVRKKIKENNCSQLDEI